MERANELAPPNLLITKWSLFWIFPHIYRNSKIFSAIKLWISPLCSIHSTVFSYSGSRSVPYFLGSTQVIVAPFGQHCFSCVGSSERLGEWISPQLKCRLFPTVRLYADFWKIHSPPAATFHSDRSIELPSLSISYSRTDNVGSISVWCSLWVSAALLSLSCKVIWFRV